MFLHIYLVSFKITRRFAAGDAACALLGFWQIPEGRSAVATAWHVSIGHHPLCSIFASLYGQAHHRDEWGGAPPESSHLSRQSV